jgi:hypothetical protein
LILEIGREEEKLTVRIKAKKIKIPKILLIIP